MRLSPAFLRAVDEWRRKQPDLPGRSESIRRLTLEAIAASKGGRKK
jgi:hypothetical protein